MAKKSLINLAKTSKKPATSTKISAIKNETKPLLTSEDEKRLKAKQKVDELLGDVTLNTIKNPQQPQITNEGGNEWLGEQVTLLNDQVQNLRNELADSKEDYRKIFEENQKLKNGNSDGVYLNNAATDSDLANQVISFFRDFQMNYSKMPGVDAYGRPNMVIHPVAFINLMVEFMPFLANEKRF